MRSCSHLLGTCSARFRERRRCSRRSARSWRRKWSKCEGVSVRQPLGCSKPWQRYPCRHLIHVIQAYKSRLSLRINVMLPHVRTCVGLAGTLPEREEPSCASNFCIQVAHLNFASMSRIYVAHPSCTSKLGCRSRTLCILTW